MYNRDNSLLTNMGCELCNARDVIEVVISPSSCFLRWGSAMGMLILLFGDYVWFKMLSHIFSYGSFDISSTSRWYKCKFIVRSKPHRDIRGLHPVPQWPAGAALEKVAYI